MIEICFQILHFLPKKALQAEWILFTLTFPQRWVVMEICRRQQKSVLMHMFHSGMKAPKVNPQSAIYQWNQIDKWDQT